jgi:hypothetical protein
VHKLDRELLETGEGSEMPLEDFVVAGIVTEDVVQECIVSGVTLRPGVGAYGAGVGIEIGEEDWKGVSDCPNDNDG